LRRSVWQLASILGDRDVAIDTAIHSDVSPIYHINSFA
jgi:hypothetical protein